MGAEGLGVVILAYGGEDRHAALVEQLLDQGVPAAAIAVVHNPARPGETAPPAPPGCTVLQSQRNLGYAGGMNLGIEAQRERGAESLLLLTHDVRLRPGAVEALLGEQARQPRFGVLGPSLLLPGSEEPFSFGGMTDRAGVNRHLGERPAGAGVHACDWVDGGAMLVRAAVFDRIGGFDERFWGYCEEADLCLRARRGGFGVGVVLAAAAEQDSGATKRPGAWAYLTTRNGLAYARRAVGRSGLAAHLLGLAWYIGLNAARTVLRSLRLRRGPAVEPWALAVGAARGTLDFLRGRWGPPPPGLPGMGDLRNA